MLKQSKLLSVVLFSFVRNAVYSRNGHLQLFGKAWEMETSIFMQMYHMWVIEGLGVTLGFGLPGVRDGRARQWLSSWLFLSQL